MDSRVLKLRTPISRKGKGDSTYWTEATQQFEISREGFEVICPNCLAIEQVNKKMKDPLKGKPFISKYPHLAITWSGPGFGQKHLWADTKVKEGYSVLFIKDQDVFVYKYWDKPLCDLYELAEWFGCTDANLTQEGETVILEKVD